MQPGLVGVVVGRIHLGILGSVVNNCYFLCNFIFVISAPLDSIIICEYADIYGYGCGCLCEKGTFSGSA